MISAWKRLAGYSLLFPAVLAVTGLTHAGDWPTTFKEKSMSSCIVDVSSYGYDRERSTSICTCFVDGVEAEWPMERLGEYVSALDEPASSPTNRRLVEIAEQCGVPLP